MILLKKIIRNKENYFYMLLLILFSLMLILVINYKSNFYRKLNDDFKKNISGRTLMISPQNIEKFSKEEFENYEYDFDKIKKINHIVAIYYPNLETTASIKLSNNSGDISLKVGMNGTLPSNIKGKKLSSSDTNKIICPINMKLLINGIESDKIINTENFINKNITIIYNEYEKKDGKLIVSNTKNELYELIGIYDSEQNYLNNSDCFISYNDLNKIYKKSVDVYNEDYISSLNVVVDNIENISYVRSELFNLGYNSILNLEIDSEEVKNVEFIFYLTMIISILGIVILTILFLKKRNIENKFDIGVLKSIGYKNNEIIYFYTIQTIIVSSITIMISFLISIIIYLMLIKFYSGEFNNNMYTLKITIESYLYVIIIILLIPNIVNIIFLSRTIKNKTIKLLKEE